MTRPNDGVTGTTTVNYAALEAARVKLKGLADEFRNIPPEVGGHHKQVLVGAGEFCDEIEMGAVKFLMSWHEALNVCGQSAGLIAGNIHNLSLSFNQVDVDQQAMVRA